MKKSKRYFQQPEVLLNTTVSTGLAATLASLLAGCGGGSDSSSQTDTGGDQPTPVILAIQSITSSVSENAGEFNAFQITLSNSVDIDTVVEYNVEYGEFSWRDETTIAANQTSTTITLTVNDDSFDEEDEPITITLNQIISSDENVKIDIENNNVVIIVTDTDDEPITSHTQRSEPMLLTAILKDLDNPVVIDSVMDSESDKELIFIALQDGRILQYSINEGGSLDLDQEYSIATLFDEALSDSEYRAQGLIGIAVNPNSHNEIFIQYVQTKAHSIEPLLFTSMDTVIAKFDTDDNTLTTLLTVQDSEYHNGGLLQIHENYLYVAMGDGITPFLGKFNIKEWLDSNPAQSTESFAGSLARISLDEDEMDFSAWEVLGYGFRNPWGFYITDNNKIIVADVGWNGHEEIDVLSINSSPSNFGWPIAEGPETILELREASENLSNIDPNSLLSPIYSYPHDGSPAAVVGGVLYSDLQEKNIFIFADFMQASLSALDFNTDFSTIESVITFNLDYQENGDEILNPVSFDSNSKHDIYLLDYASGTLFEIQPFVEPTIIPDVSLSVDLVDGTDDGVSEAKGLFDAFTVTLSKTIDKAVQFTYTITHDANPSTHTATILAGQSTTTISVNVIDDNDVETGETFVFTLDQITSSHENSNVEIDSNNNTVTVDIIDDDAPITEAINITLNDKSVHKFTSDNFSFSDTQGSIQAVRIDSLPVDGSLLLVNNLEIKTYTITVQSEPAFIIDGDKQADISIRYPGVYTFDQSDNSNSSHPFEFTESTDGVRLATGDLEGVSFFYNDASKQNDIIVISQDTDDFFYSCKIHNGMGGDVSINIGSSEIITVSSDQVLSLAQVSKLVYFPSSEDGSFEFSVQDQDGNWSEPATFSFDIA